MSAVLEFPVKPEARPYLDAFAENAEEPQWLRELRRRSLTWFAEAGFPSRHSEGWRYFDLRPLAERPRPPAAGATAAAMPAASGFDRAAVRIVMRDGRVLAPTAGFALSEGVWLGSMQRAIGERGDLVRRVAGCVAGAEQPFAALNAALFADGYVLEVGPGIVLDAPIAVVRFAATEGSMHARSVISLGAGSRATIVETYAGEGQYWRNDVVVARLAPGAQLTRVVVVEEGPQAIHTALFDAVLDNGARLDSFGLLLGGSRVRQEWNVRLAGEGAHCRLDGAFIVAGADEANIVASVDHAAPRGATRELIKGVAADRGHGAFQGRIVVREHAQKTDAHQLSRNLMIGRRAVIDTKPELEILADDVKCSHGASVGDLDAAALFYLRARGIPPDVARRMLIEAFLREVTDGVDDAGIRDYLLLRLTQRLAALEEQA